MQCILTTILTFLFIKLSYIAGVVMEYVLYPFAACLQLRNISYRVFNGSYHSAVLFFIRGLQCVFLFLVRTARDFSQEKNAKSQHVLNNTKAEKNSMRK